MTKDVTYVALSHAVLAGTGIYCLYQIRNADFFCPFVSYGVVVANNVLGVCWCTKSFNLRLDDAFKFTSFCQLLFVLPCINTQVWLQNGYSKEMSWAWAIVPVIPFVCYVVNADLDLPLVDLIIICNLLGLGFVTINQKINMGIAATVAYAVAHYCTSFQYDGLYNYTLSLFSYFALCALGFGNDN